MGQCSVSKQGKRRKPRTNGLMRVAALAFADEPAVGALSMRKWGERFGGEAIGKSATQSGSASASHETPDWDGNGAIGRTFTGISFTGISITGMTIMLASQAYAGIPGSTSLLNSGIADCGTALEMACSG